MWQEHIISKIPEHMVPAFEDKCWCKMVIKMIGRIFKPCKYGTFAPYKGIYKEDICFFEVNTKYISPSELKTSEFSRVRRKKQIFFLYNTRAFSNSQGRR